MDDEGILIEVDQGRVTRVSTNGVPLIGGAAVTYDGGEILLLPVREPTKEEQIERIVTALREGRANSQRHRIRIASEAASKHYLAIAQATGALANLLSDLACKEDGDPVALVTRIQESVNRIDDDILREVRQQLLVTCAQAMELRFGEVEEEEHHSLAPAQSAAMNEPQLETGTEDSVPPEPYRVAYQR